MADPLNIYGDGLVTTTGKHGADISSQRMDDLDVEAILYALKVKGTKGAALDLGCGIGFQGLRFASLGLQAVLVDRMPVEMTVLSASGLEDLLCISYLSKDARELTRAELPAEVSICYSQRFIHYLRFDEAVLLLRLVRGLMLPDAKMFLSASGLLSELGDGYPGKSQRLSERFCPLAAPMAEKHNIHEPVCLYTPDDLVALCLSASFSCDRIYSSAFGNVKGVFTSA
jgi:hypothetical protein